MRHTLIHSSKKHLNKLIIYTEYGVSLHVGPHIFKPFESVRYMTSFLRWAVTRDTAPKWRDGVVQICALNIRNVQEDITTYYINKIIKNDFNS